MPRIRTIKPDFWTDEKIVELSITARLFFIGLWNFADDNGVLEFKPKQLKLRIFPADDIDVVPLLRELHDQKLIVLYQIDNHKYLQIKNFTKHQVVDKPRKNCLPLPSDPGAQLISTDFNGNQPASTEIKLGKGREKEKEEEKEKKSTRAKPPQPDPEQQPAQQPTPLKSQPAVASHASPPDGGNGAPSRCRVNLRSEDFEEFYKLYPRKTARKRAEETWKAKIKQGRLPPLGILLQALQNHKQSRQWLDGIIPHPATWLSQERWNDEMPANPENPNPWAEMEAWAKEQST